MKTDNELLEIRKQAIKNMTMRLEKNNIRMAVGMATCGIGAGSRNILEALTKKVSDLKLKHVTIAQTGCMGKCELEPILEVEERGKEKVVYVKMTPEKVGHIIEEHIIRGKRVEEYTN